MGVSVNQLRQQRAKIIDQARGLLNVWEAAGRDPTTEERSQFETMMNEADAIEKKYSLEERMAVAEFSLTQSQGRQTDPGQPGYQPGGQFRSGGVDGVERRGFGYEVKSGARSSEQYEAAYRSFLRYGEGGCSEVERRALTAENDAQGGYLLAPQQFVSTLIKRVDDLTPVRQLATKFMVTGAESLGAPSLDADPADATWTSELATGTEDSTMAFGKRELHPRPIAKRVKVSRKLLSRVPWSEGIVIERLGYKFAVTAEQGYMTGDGANKPLGVFTASTSGISTGRDVSTGNTSSAITMDGLINALYSLKQGYRRSNSLAWVFHRDAIKMIRKLRSDSGAGAGTGDYLWQPSTQAGQPDLLLNVPVFESEFAPNTFTTGLYVGIIGDFSNYWIADADTFSIQRLVELYAETNQTGYIGRLETDGMPVLEEAFARVKLA